MHALDYTSTDVTSLIITKSIEGKRKRFGRVEQGKEKTK